MSDWKDTATETEQVKPVDNNRPLSPTGRQAMQGFSEPSIPKSPEPATVSETAKPPQPPPEHTPKSAYGETGFADRAETSAERTEVMHFSREGHKHK